MFRQADLHLSVDTNANSIIDISKVTVYLH